MIQGKMIKVLLGMMAVVLFSVIGIQWGPSAMIANAEDGIDESGGGDGGEGEDEGVETVIGGDAESISSLSDTEMKEVVGGHYSKRQCKLVGGHCPCKGHNHQDPGCHPVAPPPPPPPPGINILGSTKLRQLDNSLKGIPNINVTARRGGKNNITRDSDTAKSSGDDGRYRFCAQGTFCLKHDPTYYLEAQGFAPRRIGGAQPRVKGEHTLNSIAKNTEHYVDIEMIE